MDFLLVSRLLPVVRGVLKIEFKAVSWNLENVLPAIYSFFNEEPARKVIYIFENESASFYNPYIFFSAVIVLKNW